MDFFSYAIADARSAAEHQLGHKVDCGWFGVSDYFNITIQESVLSAALSVGCEVEDQTWTLRSKQTLSEGHGFIDPCTCRRDELHEGIWIDYDVSWVRMCHVNMARRSGAKIWNEYRSERKEEFTPLQLKQLLRQVKKIAEAAFRRWASTGTSRPLSLKYVLVSGENSPDRFEMLRDAIASVLEGIPIGWRGQDIGRRFLFSAGAARKYRKIIHRRMLLDFENHEDERLISNGTS